MINPLIQTLLLAASVSEQRALPDQIATAFLDLQMDIIGPSVPVIIQKRLAMATALAAILAERSTQALAGNMLPLTDEESHFLNSLENAVGYGQPNPAAYTTAMLLQWWQKAPELRTSALAVLEKINAIRALANAA